MSTQTGKWRAGLDSVDAALIDEYQSGFPVTADPFAVVGERLDVPPADALERVATLRERGIFRRFGAVLNPPVIGSSTLAAVKAPADRFDEVAAVVNEHPQVNHNYRRDHEWNMWFVVTAASLAKRDAILDAIETGTGCTVLNLPMRTSYYIDLEFPVVNCDQCAGASQRATDVEPTRVSPEAMAELSTLERRLIVAIQDGFPLTRRPYRAIAEELSTTVDDVVAAIQRLLAENCIKRVGCVVNHVVTGFDSNCMVVWDVPDEDLDALAADAGGLPFVTLCYHRPRRPGLDWDYNLFTMVHGRDRDAVDRKIDDLASDYLPVSHERLYSTATLKQTGARYESLIDD
jgi:DNA-binding Lrp family transcriptional regulator